MRSSYTYEDINLYNRCEINDSIMELREALYNCDTPLWRIISSNGRYSEKKTMQFIDALIDDGMGCASKYLRDLVYVMIRLFTTPIICTEIKQWNGDGTYLLYDSFCLDDRFKTELKFSHMLNFITSKGLFDELYLGTVRSTIRKIYNAVLDKKVPDIDLIMGIDYSGVTYDDERYALQESELDDNLDEIEENEENEENEKYDYDDLCIDVVYSQSEYEELKQISLKELEKIKTSFVAPEHFCEALEEYLAFLNKEKQNLDNLGNLFERKDPDNFESFGYDYNVKEYLNYRYIDYMRLNGKVRLSSEKFFFVNEMLNSVNQIAKNYICGNVKKQI